MVDDYVVIAHIGDSRIYLLPRRVNSPRSPPTTRSCSDSSTPAASRAEEATVPSAPLGAHARARRHRRRPRDRHLHHARHQPTATGGCSAPTGCRASSTIRTSCRGQSAGHRAKQAADQPLEQASLDGGAPDNVTIVVVDIGEPAAPATPPIVGSAATPLAFGAPLEPARPRGIRLAPFRPHPVQETHFEPDSAEFLDELIEEDARRRRRRRWVWGFWIVALVAAIVAAFVLGYQWTQTRYFVGESNGRVVVYQGIQQNIGPISLHDLHTETPDRRLRTARLRPAARRADDQRRAHSPMPMLIVQRLRGLP